MSKPTLNRRAEFVRALAEYMVKDQAVKSIQLKMQDPAAIEWARLRNLTPIFGYVTLDEAEQILRDFLF